MKTVTELVTNATDDQILKWHSAIKDMKWPEDLPIPAEAFEAIWHKLHRRAITIHVKEKRAK